MPKAKPSVNGVSATHDRREQLKELRERQKQLQRDLALHRQMVKDDKEELAGVSQQIGTAIDDFDQPLLFEPLPPDEGRE